MILRAVLVAVVALCQMRAVAAEPAPPLVDVAWLGANLCAPDLMVLDVRRSRNDYLVAHIPCAVHTNYYEDGWRIRRQGIAHMIPPPAALERLIGGLGIGNGSQVVIYASGTGPFDAAETTSIYFTFRYLGHDAVSILDGGLPAWMADWENDFDVGAVSPEPRDFTAAPRPRMLAGRDDVLAASAGAVPLVDMRSHDMYLGINRAEVLVRPGTIPGALNLPMSWITVNDSLYFRAADQLEALFAAAGAPARQPMILFCNAGLESSLGWFAAHALLGNRGVRLYDGSLAEWSADPTLPMTVKVPLP
ncbi:MAG: rhodanese-like domain-containing protein [Alphaproteobacteria bacterium]|jgi:thiosulfate/3-mercaptopyruvate sulfurtransferase|nr:rhodanese-like domain-containing protein [Alphaproteobacteria bacterium]MDP6515798.1 rhodanese-like domain-containing protein [Alphaproteobacteria bacterium]